MRRRDFMKIVGGSVAAWPLAARAQQPARMRRIGMLAGGLAADDPEWQVRSTALVQALAHLGWTDGRNGRIDFRFGLGDPERRRQSAAELVALGPDVLVAGGGSAVQALQQATRTVPIVFASAIDPVGEGFVTSLVRPGGNTTGFMSIEFGVSGKWLELLRQIAPRVARVAVLRNATTTEIAQFAAIQAVAPSFGVEVIPVIARDASELENNIMEFARAPNSGLIAPNPGTTQSLRDRIIALAARNGLLAVYAFGGNVTAGGLISYGPDYIDQYRQAAGYVDRILKGEKPADLPVQAPTKYATVLNMKTAKAL